MFLFYPDVVWVFYLWLFLFLSFLCGLGVIVFGIYCLFIYLGLLFSLVYGRTLVTNITIYDTASIVWL